MVTSSRTSDEIQILLIFHSTRSNNLGVGALTVSEIEVIRTAAARSGRQVHINVLDWKEDRAPYLAGPDISVRDVAGRYMFSPFGYFADARRADIVIDIGAGDSFADIYGRRRLSRIFLLKFLTHIAGTPLVVAPQTIGPFNRPVSKLLARMTLNRSSVLCTRDRKSTECLREIGVTRPVIEASDVALRLPYAEPAVRPPGRPRVGINVSGLLMNGGYDRRNMFGLSLDYPGLMARIVTSFLEHPEKPEVHLVPHVIVEERGAVEDDLTACTKLAEGKPGVIVAPRFRSPSEAKTYIAGLDFFAGARMHACIAAFSSGVAVVPMAYSRKFAGLFGSLGYTRTVDCTGQDEATILSAVIDGFSNRALLAAEARSALSVGRQKLAVYEDALVALLGEVGGTVPPAFPAKDRPEPGKAQAE